MVVDDALRAVMGWLIPIVVVGEFEVEYVVLLSVTVLVVVKDVAVVFSEVINSRTLR